MCLTCGHILPRSFASEILAALFIFHLLFVLLTITAKIFYLHILNSIAFRLFFHFLMSKLSSNIPLMFSRVMSSAK